MPFWLCPVPNPTRPVPKPYQKYFFLAENGYVGGTHAAVPRQYSYPQGTRYRYGRVFAVPVLPCLLLKDLKIKKNKKDEGEWVHNSAPGMNQWLKYEKSVENNCEGKVM